MNNFTLGRAKMLKLSALSASLVFIAFSAFSQSSITIGDPAYNKSSQYNTYGPMRTVPAAYTAGPISNRHAYIYPASTLVAIMAQSKIDSLAFYKIFAGTLQGTPSLKIYFKNTADADFGPNGITWSTEISNATLVYSNNPSSAITSSVGYKVFKFNSGFLYSGGNLAIYIEYTQSEPATDYVTWLYDVVTNPFGDNTLKFDANSTATFPATLTTSGTIHPVLKLFYTPPPPAPLKLIDFSVSSSATGNQLKWVTSKEENLAGFTVEKSINGTGFAAIGNITAFNQTANSTYSYPDKAVNNGTVYYRLKMNDKNGAFSYSRIVTVSRQAKANFNIYPNPVKGTLQVQLPGAKESSALSIADISGRVLITKQIQSTGSVVSTYIDVSQLPAGLYHIVLQNNLTKQVQQFIRQ